MTLNRAMAVHAWAYCPRLFYLEEVEEIRLADERVYAGRELHLRLASEEEGDFHTLTLESETWGLISYDVGDDKRRAKIAKCLEGYGERLQYSVFRTFLSGRALAQLRWELSRKMAAEDGLLIIHLCPSCQARVEDRHGKRDWREEAPLGFRIAGGAVKHLPSLEASQAELPHPPRENSPQKTIRSMKQSK